MTGETEVARASTVPKRGRGVRGALLKRHRLLARLLFNPAALAGLLAIMVLLFVAGIPHLFTHWDPVAVNAPTRLLPPGSLHLFGTDELGRDVFSRVLYGARLSLAAAGLVVLLAALVGVALGAVAGYSPGFLSESIMRVTDMLIAFPQMIAAMTVAYVLGPGVVNAAISVAALLWTQYARLMRAQVLQIRSREFVLAARSIGASELRILLRHILPSSVSPIFVQASLDFGVAVLTLGALSFIGVGAQPPSPEWGAMVAGGRTILFEAWWVSTFPGLAIFVFVMATNLLGDALRDIFDPRLQS